MSRRPAPVTPPVALTIATSDSGGGAGVQADLKTMEASDDRAARFLLAARAGAPELRFVLGCSCDGRVERTLKALGGPVAEIEGDGSRTAAERESTSERVREDAGTGRATGAIRRAFEAGENEPSGDGDSNGDTNETPVAAIERRGDEGERVAWIVAPEADTLVERTIRVYEALETREGE